MTMLTDREAMKACYCLPGYEWSEDKSSTWKNN